MITITNNKIYRSEVPININNFNNAEILSNSDIMCFLSEIIELGESVTLKTLFDIIIPNVNKFNELFYSSLNGLELEPFIQEIESNSTKNIDIETLEVYWLADKFDSDISINSAIHGTFKNYDIAIDFIGLNNIKFCPIKLNTKLDILNYNNISNNEETITKIGYKEFTLFEVFNSILKEITYHGGPQDKNEILKEIEDSINDEDLEDLEDFKDGVRINIENIFDQIDKNDNFLVKFKDHRIRVNSDKIEENNLEDLKILLLEKLKLYDKIENTETDLKKLANSLKNLEYDIQKMYGDDENVKYHIFWDTPKCTCPKIDNIEIYPSDNPIINKDCPLHGY